MTVLIGVKEDLSDAKSGPALSMLGNDMGVRTVRVNRAHPHLMLVDYDERQVRRVDILSHLDQLGLRGKVCGC